MVMSLLRRLTSVRWVPRLRQSKILSTSANIKATDSYIEKFYKLTGWVLNAGGLALSGVGMCYLYFTWEESKINYKVLLRFKEGYCPDGLREDDYIQRNVQDKITAEFCDKTDTDGLFGIVFGAAGTGKSTVLRHICKERYDISQSNPQKPSGVLYVELGPDARFAHKIAETCGIPLKPNMMEVVIAEQFPSWKGKTYLTLPQNDEITALAQVFSVIEKGGLLYKKMYGNKVPVLIIDGADIVAKNDEKQLLFDALLEWAKKCSKEDTVLVVMGCSDGHVLRYLDKQACKSRAALPIEVTDFPTFDSLEKLFMVELGYPPKKHEAAQKIDEVAERTVRADAQWMFNEITGGRLTDIYKATRLYKKLVAEDPRLPTEVIKEEIKHAFESEIKQALNKAMDDPFDLLQLEIAAAVVDRNLPHAGNRTLSVHELALELVHHGVAKSIEEAKKAVEKFVDNNILRYNAKQELVAHSMMAGKVLKDLVTSSGIQQRRCWQEPWYKRLRGDEHSNKCFLNTSNSSSQKQQASNGGNHPQQLP